TTAQQYALDQAIAARVDQRIQEVSRAARRRPGVSAVLLNLGLVALGIGGTGIIVPLMQAPEALLGLIAQWTAIAVIGASYSSGAFSGGHQGDKGRHLPPPQQQYAVPAPPLAPAV